MICNIKMPTLHETRLNALPKLPKTWFAMLDDEAGNLWEPALRACYDTLSAEVFNDVRFRTFAINAPLEPNGRYGTLGLTESGLNEELLVAPPGTGYCAERKILQNNLLAVHSQFTGESDIWLFYITRSPCIYCGQALVEALEKGVCKHLVVAFEGCYQPNDLERALPEDKFFDRVKPRYDPRSPGIELFKVYRSEEDTAMFRDGELLGEANERIVYDMILGKKSRRRKDVGPETDILRRETRSSGIFRTKAGDLPVFTEVKDMVSVDDATLRFVRVTRV